MRLSRKALASSVIFRASGLRIIAVVLGVVGSIAIARLGGVAVRGDTSTFMAITNIVFALINFDLAQQALRQNRADSEHGAGKRWLAPAWVAYLTVATLVVALVWHSRPEVGLIAVGSALLAISMQSGVLTNGFKGPVVMAIAAVVQQGCLLLFVVVLAWAGHLTTFTAALAVCGAYAASALTNLIAHGPAPDRQSPGVLRLAWDGLSWLPLRFGQVILSRADTVAVFLLLGSAPAGIYSVGLSLAALVGIVPAQVSQRTLHQGATGQSVNLRKSLGTAVMLSVACSVPVVVVGYWALLFLYGREFVSAYPVLVASLPGVAAYSAYQVLANYTRLFHSARLTSESTVVGVVLMLVGLAVAIPVLGVTGAALAYSLASSGAAVYLAWALRRRSVGARLA